MNTKEQPQHALLLRIRGEFLEMPGLRLTPVQAQRLWALDYETCADVLDALVDTAFLARSTDGRYMRASDGLIHAASPMRMIEADVAFEPRRRVKRVAAPR